MAKWQSLPDELVLYILRNLKEFRDHRSASFVSRQFHVFIEPQLYSSVSLLTGRLYDNYGNDLDEIAERQTRSFRRFVRTIVGRPALGALVGELWLRSWDTRDFHHKYNPSEDIRRYHLNFSEQDSQTALALLKYGEARDDLTMIARAVAAKGLPNGMVLAAESRGLALVLLHFLPNLKTFHMVSHHEMETLALSCLNLFDGGVPAGLSSISSLEIEYDAPRYNLDIDDTQVDVCA